jgi:diguanylate cyclase (GGDEF)-like protein/PAS domain S-box-containing protein
MQRLFESFVHRLDLLKEEKLSRLEISELVDDQLVLLKSMFDDALDGMMVLDESGRCLAANHAQSRLLGYSHETLLEMYAWEWDVLHSKQATLDMLHRTAHGVRFLSQHRRNDGRVIDVEISSNIIQFHREKLFFLVCRDVTLKKQREDKIHQQSITDALTGLANRAEFNRILHAEIRRAARYHNTFSVLMFDLDHFKKINDEFGHDKGDKVLKAISTLLLAHLRESDTLSRWGGEEFMVLLPETNRHEATLLAEKLRLAVEEYDFSVNRAVTISIGVSEFQKGESGKSLFKRVDEALYSAKGAGRNQVAVI